jgi:hypothetical protein
MAGHLMEQVRRGRHLVAVNPELGPEQAASHVVDLDQKDVRGLAGIGTRGAGQGKDQQGEGAREQAGCKGDAFPGIRVHFGFRSGCGGNQ